MKNRLWKPYVHDSSLALITLQLAFNFGSRYYTHDQAYTQNHLLLVQQTSKSKPLHNPLLNNKKKLKNLSPVMQRFPQAGYSKITNQGQELVIVMEEEQSRSYKKSLFLTPSLLLFQKSDSSSWSGAY